MTEATVTATAASAAPPRWLRILRNPLVRIFVFVGMLVLFGYAMRWLLPPTGHSIEEAMATTGPALWLGALRSLVPVCLAYWILVRFIEGRRVDELAPRKLLPHVGIGWLVGFAIMCLAAGLMAAFGAYRVHGLNEAVPLLAPLVVLGLLPGITEEIFFRGVLFRVVEDGLGTWAALAVSALFFGAVHYGNPNATLWSSLAIAIEAGILLGMAYAWTRSLWFCMGLHAAWNFTQGPLLNIPVSGIQSKGLLDTSLQGSPWISGGAFGAEASVVTVLMCTALGIWFGRRAIAAGQVRPPFWRRPRPAATTPVAEPSPSAIN